MGWKSGCCRSSSRSPPWFRSWAAWRALLWGPTLTGGPLVGFGDSQFRYLSGVLVGVGAAYWMVVPSIEREGPRLFMLTLIVVVGGFSRASALLLGGPAGPAAYAALVMELIVAPGVYLWQTRIAQLASMDAPAAGR